MNFIKYTIIFSTLTLFAMQNVKADISSMFQSANQLLNKNRTLSLLIGGGLLAGTGYFGYKKSTKAQNAWQRIKKKADDYYDNYNVPVSIGTIAKLGIVGIAGLCLKQYVFDKIDFSKYTKSVTDNLTFDNLKSKYNKMSPYAKLASGVCAVAGIAITGLLTRKIYKSVVSSGTDDVQAFTRFKESLNEDQKDRFKELLDKIEQDKAVIVSSHANELLESLSQGQHILAERVVTA